MTYLVGCFYWPQMDTDERGWLTPGTWTCVSAEGRIQLDVLRTYDACGIVSSLRCDRLAKQV